MITLDKSRILIVGPSWIGDMVMAQSLLKLLRSQNDTLELTVLAPSWSRALLERMPEVDQSIESPFNHGDLKILERKKFAKDLRGKFDKAIILPNSFKSALIPYFARTPIRVGWRGEVRNLLLTDCRLLDTLKFPQMVQRFLALGLEATEPLPDDIPEPELQTDRALAQSTAKKLDLPTDNKVLILCPGAEFGDAKQWPSENFANLCVLAAKEGWQIWVVGSSNDRQVAIDIIDRLDSTTRLSIRDITGRTSLNQVIDLLSLADAVVSNDSGLMHIAAAVGSPVLAIYGSTSPEFTPPLAERVKLLTTEIECRPCFERTCPLGHKRCLTEITAQSVLLEINKLIATKTILEF
jgi:heptosyltransferase-2